MECDEGHGLRPSDHCRGPTLEPKHRIFLSHSGAQKSFTEQLCEDLKRVQHYPFFDRRDDSLPKGEKFPPLILEAARQCRVAVLVISDEFFTRSKWPMIELNEFVRAQESSNRDLKILPLFLGLTMEEFRNKERQAGWFKKWEEFADLDKRIKVEDWKASLSRIPGGINAEEYGGVGQGEVSFRKKVVKDICRLLPPDLKYDVSHVQSLEWLCEPIMKKLEEVEVSSHFNVKVVGLYGMGGVGKTTISTAICNEMFKDFGGKVCHVELGGDSKRLVKLLKRVLRECTSVNAPLMFENDSKKLDELLKQHMDRQEVFLVLDNVWDDQVDEALKYLKAGHHAKSMVLVTSRSLEVLKRLRIGDCNCMEMTNLEKEGAKDVLLHYSGISRESILDKSEWEIVERYVTYCCFSSGKKATWRLGAKEKYHPLALKALGSQLVTFEIKDWDENLKSLDKFNIWKDDKHPVFSILRVGFDLHQKELQELFLDLALLWKPRLYFHRSVASGNEHCLEWESLCTLHGVPERELMANVKALQRKGLLEKVHDITKLDYSIHDLYYEFAEAEAQANQFEGRGILLNKAGIDVPRELEQYPPNGLWPYLKRLIILESRVKSLEGANLHRCKNVEVLVLNRCSELEEVNVTGMDNLRLMVVTGCGSLGNLTGLETLNNLVYFCGRAATSQRCLGSKLAFCSTKLQVVRLGGFQGLPNGNMFPLDPKSYTKLKEVTLNDGCIGLPYWLHPVDVGKYLPTSIHKLDIPRLGGFSIDSMATFQSLQDLNLSHCNDILELTGLCKLILLEKLDVSHTRISMVLDEQMELKHLQYLDVSRCSFLRSIVGIVRATALQTVLALGCGQLGEVPYDLSSLQQLEVLDLRGARRICSLPLDYKRLAEYSGSERKSKVKVDGCLGLIVPLVRKLRGSEVARDACEDGCNCVSKESMRSWIAAKKHVDIAAYNLLKDVLCFFEIHTTNSRKTIHWVYLLDDEAVIEVLIRGLCEHDVRGSRTTDRLSAVVQEVTKYAVANFCAYMHWWVVVATAPCTFKAVTDGAMMKPWRETLLHYTMISILPRFLFRRNLMIYYHLEGYRWFSYEEDDDEQGDESNTWFLKTWHYRAIVAVLQKCREKLDEAGEHDDPMRCLEGKRIVHTFLSGLEAAKSEILEDESTLMVLIEGL